jgi:hypothetical protein
MVPSGKGGPADDARIGEAVQLAGQRRQPAGMHFRVVVEEDHVFAPRQQRPLVARLGESQVLRVPPDGDVAPDSGQRLGRPVGAPIVDDDDLEGGIVARVCSAIDTSDSRCIHLLKPA